MIDLLIGSAESFENRNLGVAENVAVPLQKGPWLFHRQFLKMVANFISAVVMSNKSTIRSAITTEIVDHTRELRVTGFLGMKSVCKHEASLFIRKYFSNLEAGTSRIRNEAGKEIPSTDARRSAIKLASSSGMDAAMTEL